MTPPLTNSASDTQDEEIDILDLFVILSEHLKTLIVLPLLGLLIAGGFVLWQSQKPKVYVSTSSIAVEKPVARDERPRIRPEVVASLINTGQAFTDFRDASMQVSASLGRQDRLLNITVTATTPESAQTSNQSVLEKLFEITALSGPEAERLQNLLQSERVRLTEIQKMIAEAKLSSQTTPDAIRAHGELLNLASNREFAIAKIEQELAGLSIKDVVQMPTLPTAPQSTRKAIPLLAGFIGGGFIALLWIFMRHALRGAQNDPTQRTKLDQLKANLGFKS